VKVTDIPIHNTDIVYAFGNFNWSHGSLHLCIVCWNGYLVGTKLPMPFPKVTSTERASECI
jgi:hypothetical protein